MSAIKWFQWNDLKSLQKGFLYFTLLYHFSSPHFSTHTHTRTNRIFHSTITQLLFLIFFFSFSLSSQIILWLPFVLLLLFSFIHSSFIRCCGITRSLGHIEALTFTFNFCSCFSLLFSLDWSPSARQVEIWRLMSNFYRSQVLCAPTRKRREEGRKGGKFGEIGKRIFCFLVQSFNRGGSGGGGGMQIISLSVSVSFRFNTFIFSVLSLALSFFSLYLTHCPTKTGRAWPNWLPKLALTGR